MCFLFLSTSQLVRLSIARFLSSYRAHIFLCILKTKKITFSMGDVVDVVDVVKKSRFKCNVWEPRDPFFWT